MFWSKHRYEKPKMKRIERNPSVFNVGDKVCISNIRTAFQREYDTKWSAEIFKVKERFIRQGQPIYKIVDWDNQLVEGTFYQKEI